MEPFRIDLATEFSPTLLDEIRSLIPQLSSTARAPTAVELKSIIESPSTCLFVAKDGLKVVGMLTLVLVRIPSGLRAHIEDVVVATPYRRRGLGDALTRAALDLATKVGARTVDLTSRPTRVAAIRLYERLGFRRRDTVVFRFSPNSAYPLMPPENHKE